MASVNPYGVIVNGVRLDSLAVAVATRSGWESTPGLVGDNVKIPGRDGVVWQPKDYGEGRMVVSLLISGVDEDGTVPGGSTAEETFRENLDRILALFGARAGLLEVEKEYEGGVSRLNYGEVATVITPDYPGDEDPFATMTVELTFPDPLWADAEGFVEIEPGGSATSPQDHTLTDLGGSTAPIPDATLLVVGPAVNPRLSDLYSPASIQLNGSLAAGEVWRVVPALFVSEVGTGLDYITGVGAETNVIETTTFSPGPRLFHLTPSIDTLTPVVRLSGSGFDTTTTVKVRANRRFLT